MTDLLAVAVTTSAEAGAADLHLRSLTPPRMRVHGQLLPVPGVEVLDPDEALRGLMSVQEADQLVAGEVDVVHRDCGGVSVAIAAGRSNSGTHAVVRILA